MNFDHYANVDEDVDCLSIVQEKKYYNPNSNHWLSVETNAVMNESNNIVRSLFPMYKIIEFVPSGGTGANIRAILENQSVRNVAIPELNDIIMVSAVEHSSILKKVVYSLNLKNYTVIVFPVDKNGFVAIDKFKRLFDEFANRIVLVSCIMTNNEIGTLQPIEELIRIVKNAKRNIIFHSDCACNLPHVLKYELLPDIITFSCYKFHGPHVGMLLSNIKMNNDTFGTPDIKNFYFAALTLKKYFDIYDTLCASHHEFKTNLKQSLYSAMCDAHIDFVNFDTQFTANNVLAFSITGLKTSLIQKELSKLFIAIGSGSACTTNEGSHTVKAMGYSDELGQQLVRLSFNYTDLSLIDEFVKKFIQVVKSLNYLKKQINTVQKSMNVSIVRPSVRKSVGANDVPIFNIDSLTEPFINVIQLSSAEQALKGKNKNKFNDILTNNIKIIMKKNFPEVKYKLGLKEDYHMLYFKDKHNIVDICKIFERLPGVSVISPYESVENHENIEETVARHFNNVFVKSDLTFSVRVKIAGKVLKDKTNRDWEYYLGQTIKENFQANVDLNNPNITIFVKGYGNKIYVGTQRIQGMNGVPGGSEGNMIFFVDKLNLKHSFGSILKMYSRGATPIVFTNDQNAHDLIYGFLEENCTKYVLKLIQKENISDQLAMLQNDKHIVCETNSKNIFELKQFGKLYGKYVFSNYMFNIPDLTSELFFIDQQTKSQVEYNGLVLISGGFDSPVASHLLLSNGFNHDYVHFIGNINDSVGYNKIVQLTTLLKPSSKIYFVEFEKLQEEIAKKCDESYRVMMYKIYMVLIANKICSTNGYNYIAMGNSLGQVASQTPQNLYVTDHYSELPMLSPLVGMNKNEIIEYARQIGTSQISECNGNDCCVQFLPTDPVLNASTNKINNMLNLIGNYDHFISIYEKN